MKLRKSNKDHLMLYQCKKCEMIFSQGNLSKHKLICYATIPERNQGVDKLSSSTIGYKDLSFLHENFYSDVYDHMQNDN